VQGAAGLAASGTQSFTAELDKMATASANGGAANNALAEQTKSAQFAIDQAKAAVSVAAQEIGAVLAPAIVSVAGFVKGMAGAFQQLPGPIQTLIVVGTALAGGLLLIGGAVAVILPGLGAIATVAGVAGTAIAAIASPVVIAVGLIIGAFVLLQGAGVDVIGFFVDLPGKILGAIGGLGSMIGGALKSASDSIVNFFVDLGAQAIKWGGDLIGNFVKGVISSIPILGDAIMGVGGMISDLMMPHSPPKFFPGVTEAGRKLIEEYGKGISSADISFVDQLGSAITSRFRTIMGPKASDSSILASVFGVQSDVTQAIEAMRQGGDITDAVVGRINAKLGESGKLVGEVVTAYLQLEQVEMRITQLQQDKAGIDAYLEEQIVSTNNKIAQQEQLKIEAAAPYNALLGVAAGFQERITEQLTEQAEKMQPLKRALEEANGHLTDAKYNYTKIKDELGDINEAEGRDLAQLKAKEEVQGNILANLDLQTQQITAQADLDSRFANKVVRGDQKLEREENKAWNVEKKQLQEAVNAAQASGDKDALKAAKDRQAAEREAHDQRLTNIRNQMDIDRDAVADIKAAEEDKLQPIKDQQLEVKATNLGYKDQELAIKQGAQAQRDSLEPARAAAEQAEKDAARAQANAQYKYDLENRTLTTLKEQQAQNQAGMADITARRTAAVKPFDDVIKQLDADRKSFTESETLTNKAIDVQINKLGAIKTQKQEVLAIANSRLAVENKVVDAINQQAAAVAAAAAAATKQATSAKAKAAAAKEEYKPLTQEIDKIAGKEDVENASYAGKADSLRQQREAAQAIGNTGAINMLDRAKADLDATHKTIIANLTSQRTVWSTALKQAQSDALTVPEAYNQAAAALKKGASDAAGITIESMQRAGQIGSQQASFASGERADDSKYEADQAAIKRAAAINQAKLAAVHDLDAQGDRLANDLKNEELVRLKASVGANAPSQADFDRDSRKALGAIPTNDGSRALAQSVGQEVLDPKTTERLNALQNVNPERFKELNEALRNLSLQGKDTSQAVAELQPLLKAIGLPDQDAAFLYQTGYKGGNAVPTGMKEGFTAGREDVRKAAAYLSEIGVGIADGLNSTNPSVKSAAQTVANAAAGEFAAKLAPTLGLAQGAGYGGSVATGIGGKQGEVQTASSGVATAASNPLLNLFKTLPFTLPMTIAMQSMTGAADQAIGYGATGSTFGTTRATAIVHPFTSLFSSNPLTASFGTALDNMIGTANSALGTTAGSSTVTGGMATNVRDGFNFVFGGTPFASFGTALDKAIKLGTDKVGTSSAGAGHDIGDALGAGINAGIGGWVGGIVKSVTGIVDAAVKAAKDHAEIHSPSRLMEREVGTPLAQGVIAGITGQQGAAATAMQTMIEQMLKAPLPVLDSPTYDLQPMPVSSQMGNWAVGQQQVEQARARSSGQAASNQYGGAAANTPPASQPAGGQAGGVSTTRHEYDLKVAVSGMSDDYNSDMKDKITAHVITVISKDVRGILWH